MGASAGPVVNIAAALASAHRDRFQAETALVELLERVFPGWQVLFPARRSWMWTPPNSLDVWNANPTEDAVRALMLAGFTGGVTIHSHRAERFLSCVCKAWRPKPPVDPRTL